MTQQFKFGDYVKSKDKNFLVFIRNCEDGISECLGYCPNGYVWIYVNKEDLEPIPHPDTERLDWIESRSREVSETAVIYNGYHWYSNTNEEYPIELGFPYEAVRQAIDHAMQQEQTK